MLTYSDNLASWQKTLRLYADLSKLDWADVCNKQAFNLALFCISNTQTASPMAVKAVPFELDRHLWYGQVIKWMKEHGGLNQRVEIKARRGKRSGGLASLRYKVGLASRKMIGRRSSAVGFLKSGWVAAVGQLAASMGVEGRKGYGARIFGSPKGYAVKARPDSFSPFSVIANTSASYVAGKSGAVNSTHSARASNGSRAHDLIQAGAMRALQAGNADMRRYIEGKIKERIRFFTG